MSVHIHFVRTGGLAGPAMKRVCTVDSDALPATEAEELHGLVNSANLTGHAARPAETGAQDRPDSFHYRLTIDVSGEQHNIEVSDGNMPAGLRPLVKWLMKRATPGSA